MSEQPSCARDAQTLPPRSLAEDALAAGEQAVSGKRVDGYEVLEELGRGGMGVVYKARQEGLNRLVALKMILAGAHARAEDRARFRLEAEAAAQLLHPHIVQIFEVGEHDGCPFLSLEYLDGGTLAQKLDGNPWSNRQAAELLLTLATAMHAAHQKGIVHRDLKPANVLLTADGTPKIGDFGLAKRLEDGASQRTDSNSFLGTPSYMAPEQAEGHAEAIGPATDVYALGAILYHLLTGRPPFQEAQPVETIIRLLEDEPVPPSRLNRKVGRDLEAICLKCLEKSPHKRYASAGALADDLRCYLTGEATVARPLGPLGLLKRWARHRPALAATLLVLLVLYTNHLLLLLLHEPGEAGYHHYFITGLMLLWAAGAAAFQYVVDRPSWHIPVIYSWAAMDVLFFTIFLWVKEGPASAMVVGYVLLIAVAALRFRSRLVWFVTELSLVSYAGLILAAHGASEAPQIAAKSIAALLRNPSSHWRQAGLDASPHTPIVFALSLLLMGVVMNLLLRRFRAMTDAAKR